MKLYYYLEKQHIFKLFALLTLLTIAVDFLTQRYIFTSTVYYNSFSEQLSMDQIDNIIANKDKSFYFVYPIEAVLLLLKCLCITIVIQAGLFFRNINISYSKVFKISILGEFVFLAPQLIKFLWFYFSKQTYTIDDLKTFFPLSALNIFDEKTLPLLWYYPLKTINIFEVIYWFVLGFLISNLIKRDFNASLNIVLSSYIPALVIWVSFIMFLVVTLNPA